MATENEARQILPSDGNPQTPAQTPAPEAPKEPAKIETTEAPAENADSLPEWARKSLNKANTEAASYRTQLREAQEALAKAKAPEDFEKIQQALAETQHRLTIRDHTEGIPKEVVEAEWVSWPRDEEGVKKVAAQLRSFVAAQTAGETPKVGGELAGGLNPQSNGKAEELDPAVLAKRYSRRYR